MSEINPADNAFKTAIGRRAPAAPFQFCLPHIDEGRVLHLGEGRDTYTTDELRKNDNLEVHVCDPQFNKRCAIETHEEYFDHVLCFYVICVLPPDERNQLIQSIGRYLKPDGSAYIAVRSDHKNIKGTPHEDGVVTTRGTFQKAYTEAELIEDLSLYFRLVTTIKTKTNNYILVKCRDYHYEN